MMLTVGGVARADDKSATPESSVELTVAEPGAAEFHPYRGLTYTSKGIEEVRHVARTTERGRKLAQTFFASAKHWLVYSPKEIDTLVPSPEALFAVGYAGDPKTNKPWPPHARTGDMCSLSRPGTVRSPIDGTMYGRGTHEPGEKFYDDGSGWVRPSDERKFYFVGVWNSWVVETMLDDIDHMALAYMLSGDERIARRALYMMDALSALRANRPNDRGPVDGPTPYKDRRKDDGFFDFKGNGANARVYQTMMSLDLLAASPYAKATSPHEPGMTIMQNIERHFATVHEKFYKEKLFTFYNHLLALYSNQIAQSALFGHREALKEGIDAVYGFLDNCINRDGDYFENAGGYNAVGVNYAAQMIVPLSEYDPKKYADSELYPKRSDYPSDMHFANDPRWFAAAALMPYRLIVMGRRVQYGDYYQDRGVGNDTGIWINRRRAAYLRLIYHQTDQHDWKRGISELFWNISEPVRGETGRWTARYVCQLGMSQWLDPARPEKKTKAVMPMGTDSDLLGGRLIGILRENDGPHQRALFMRGGVNASHGHDDQMGTLLYDRGMALNGMYGYHFAGSPAHMGWGSRAISHSMVVVNEDLPPSVRPGSTMHYKNVPPADLLAYVPQVVDGQAAQLIEMSSPQQWRKPAKNIQEYRRMAWMVGVSESQSYFVDLFRVRGGHVHDYAFAGPYPKKGTAEESFNLSGVSPKRVEKIWTLAGFNPKFRGAKFDQPGQSWGERLDHTTEKIKDYKGSQKLWSPPPSNGYGFIWDVRSADTHEPWTASWDMIDGKNRERLTMLNPDGMRVIVGKAPVRKAGQHEVIAIARRGSADKHSPRYAESLQSRFAAVIQAGHQSDWAVEKATMLTPAKPTASKPVIALGLQLSDGRRDVIVTTTADRPVSADQVHLDGKRGFVRFDQSGQIQQMMLQHGVSLSVGHVRLAAAQSSWHGRVKAVRIQEGEDDAVLDQTLPAGQTLAGQAITFDRPGYSHNAAYRVVHMKSAGDGVSAVGLGSQSLLGTRVIVQSIDDEGVVRTRWPNEIIGSRHNRFFTGHQAVVLDDTARKTEVIRFTTKRTLKVKDPGILRVGDHVGIRTVRPGDRYSIPTLVILNRVDQTHWRLRTNQDVTLDLPVKPGRRLVLTDTTGQRRTLATAGNDGMIHCDIPMAWIPGGEATLTINQ